MTWHPTQQYSFSVIDKIRMVFKTLIIFCPKIHFKFESVQNFGYMEHQLNTF